MTSINFMHPVHDYCIPLIMRARVAISMPAIYLCNSCATLCLLEPCNICAIGILLRPHTCPVYNLWITYVPHGT